MTAPHFVDPAGLLGEALAEASRDLMRSLFQSIINALLSADADAVVGAEYGRPTSDVHAGDDLSDRATPLSGTQLGTTDFYKWIFRCLSVWRRSETGPASPTLQPRRTMRTEQLATALTAIATGNRHERRRRGTSNKASLRLACVAAASAPRATHACGRYLRTSHEYRTAPSARRLASRVSKVVGSTGPDEEGESSEHELQYRMD